MVPQDIRIGPLGLAGQLVVPAHAQGLVLFAHGSGSSRLSPRNRYVAESLHRRRLGTLLFDLLTEDEDADRANVFDIALLAGRLVQAIDGCAAHGELVALPLGLFGASTGAAAALAAAAERPRSVQAVVSRGGRPDLAAPVLARVRAPTLLIVGEADREVLALNRDALRQLACEKQLQVVPGATHLFEEPGTLEQVADLAGAWFATQLARRTPSAASGTAAGNTP
ncbi:dienelactone hydrolase family protein [Aquabacterium sp.]|uniref:dienelactone hydrolase family protein n=1 Tax=Aquabacterium sp. TaxID=1872578 RepID=UPI003784A82D